MKGVNPSTKAKQPNIFAILKPYKGVIFLLLIFALLSNGINLLLPKMLSWGIDAYQNGNFVLNTTLVTFSVAIVAIFIFAYLQSIVQTYASEKVARDLRKQLSDKISRQSYLYIQQANPAKLLTNLTSDIDSIKMFVSMAIVAIVSSLVMIFGASILLISINWKLALAVLTIIPIIAVSFAIVMKNVRVLFKQTRENIDWLNKVINESILGAALIRVLNSQQQEFEKFLAANTSAKNIGLQILRLFASLIPIVNFVANFATLIILVLGGHFVIGGSMTLGEYAAFSNYIMMLIFPIMVIGFMSNILAQATASYVRIDEVLKAPETIKEGTLKKDLSGAIAFKQVNLVYGEKPVLKDVSFEIKPKTRTAIIGPTAAGKTQLLYLLTGLINPKEGKVEFDGQAVDDYNKENFHHQIGFVFQDSIIFNMSLLENIAFNTSVTEKDLKRAIETAELNDFIGSLPEGLKTVVSERGASLSGGQKQRIMLARALALNPKILLLDDFTARVDNKTEQKILNNIQKNYPDITLISVTQKVAAAKEYDQILVLMEGELLAQGRHEELMHSSPEYVQIYNSQQSTQHYEELHA